MRKSRPYPDDLDDTFVALRALYGYQPSLVDGSVLASVVKILSEAQTSPGGPYVTWLAGPGAGVKWKDIDLAVNANIGSFLKSFRVHLPQLDDFIERRISENAVWSRYYPSGNVVDYFVAHYGHASGGSGFASGTAAVAQRILRRRLRSGGWGNPLETAMAISALGDLGFREHIKEVDIAEFIEALQRGGWKAHPFCLDPARDGERHYAGSPALTAALCAESLSKFLDDDGHASETILRKIKDFALDRAAHLPRPLRGVICREIKSFNSVEVVALPFRVARALGALDSIDDDFLERLALANFYGWIAYSRIDDLLDGDAGMATLPVANFFLREFSAQYEALAREINGLDAYYSAIMGAMDNENFLEQASPPSPEMPGFSHFARRSMGHALPAIAICLKLGHHDQRDLDSLMAFFRNYLIARQLHDDARDWLKDFGRGKLNSVGAYLAKISNTSSYTPAVFKTLFEERGVDWVAGRIKSHTHRARAALRKMKIIVDAAPLNALLERLEVAADRSIKNRDDIQKFLRTFAPSEGIEPPSRP